MTFQMSNMALRIIELEEQVLRDAESMRLMESDMEKMRLTLNEVLTSQSSVCRAVNSFGSLEPISMTSPTIEDDSALRINSFMNNARFVANCPSHLRL